MFEGTFIYFFLLFILYLIINISVRVCIANLLKKAKEKAWKAYIPFYTVYYLVNFLNLKKSVFFMTLIPFVNLYYYNIIIKKLLESYGQDSRESVLYLIIPLYKFPELVFKRPRIITNEYELTEGFIEDSNLLFNKETKNENSNTLTATMSNDFNQINEVPEINQNNTSVGGNFNQINPTAGNIGASQNSFNQINEVPEINQNSTSVGGNFNQINPTAGNIGTNQNSFNQINEVPEINQNNTFNNINNIQENSVTNNFDQSLFSSRNAEVTDSDLKENARNITHETYVEAPLEEKEEKPAVVPFEQGRPKVCPNCGATLSSSATTCFLCGHNL